MSTQTIVEAPEWLPTRFTDPLSADYPSDGDNLIAFVEKVWTTPEMEHGFKLDAWQADLIRRILERYPQDHPNPKLAGKLRYRQVVVSIPRQQGKSVLGAILSLYGLLMHTQGPQVIGVASSVDQANIIYKRTMLVINSHPALRRRFAKVTDTRGIATADGRGTYAMKASKGAALQGIPVSLALLDELHICSPDLWTALVMGTAQRSDGMVVGITTAGDSNSVLLKDLYEQGEKAIAGDNERFGFFCWEAPANCAVDDPEAIRLANPSIVCGRMDLDQVLSDIKSIPEPDARRYRLNQFVSATNSWLPFTLWKQCETRKMPEGVRPVFAFDRAPGWKYASIVASYKVDGRTYTELVASITNPTQEQLLEYAERLSVLNPLGFACESSMLYEWGRVLKSKGHTVYSLNGPELCAASEAAYAKIHSRKWLHYPDPLVDYQLPFCVYRTTGESGRVSRKDSTKEIDSVMASIIGMYAQDLIHEEGNLQVF